MYEFISNIAAPVGAAFVLAFWFSARTSFKILQKQINELEKAFEQLRKVNRALADLLDQERNDATSLQIQIADQNTRISSLLRAVQALRAEIDSWKKVY